MQALTLWKTITRDKDNQLESFLDLLNEHNVKYCAIDSQAVNAYVEPLVSLDLDLAVAAGQLDQFDSLLTAKYRIERFPHSLNITLPRSDLCPNPDR